MTAPIVDLNPVSGADQLFDALSLLSAPGGRLHQLESDGEISVDLGLELSRVVRMCSAQVLPVAEAMIDWNSNPGSAT